MRTIKLGTTNLTHPTLAPDEKRPDNPQVAFDEAEPFIKQAAREKVDFLCLTEAFAQLNRSQTMEELAEDTDGPINTFLSSRAKQYNINLVTTVILNRAGKLTNTGVIYDRQGRLVGTYDKVHLPGDEREIMQPGDDFPVYEVEGIRVGMQTCYDLNFPEGCRILAIRGAQVIFWPNLWGGMPEAFTEIILRARAMENLVHIVSAGSVLKGRGGFREPKICPRSCVVDPQGFIRAEVGYRLGMAWATVDLADEPHAQNSRINLTHHHRMPHTYGELTKPVGG